MHPKVARAVLWAMRAVLALCLLGGLYVFLVLCWLLWGVFQI